MISIPQQPVYIHQKDYTRPESINPYAIRLAKKLKAPATLIAVEQVAHPGVPVAVTGSGVPYPKDRDVEELKKRAIPYLNKQRYELSQIWKHVDYEIEFGFPEEEVASLAEEKKPQLLVIEGDSELTTLNEWFGTYETRIASAADCPVLVVQPDTQWKPLNKILYIMDMTDARVENMRVLTQLARKLKALLQVVLISEEDMSDSDGKFLEMVDIFKRILGYKDVNFQKIYGEKSAAEVSQLVEASQADWLAIEQKNKLFFERFFDDYNTKRLILQSEIPVLVF